jgi:hypothetical protein
MPALGCGVLPSLIRKRLGKAAFNRSKVPYMRHFLNQ